MRTGFILGRIIAGLYYLYAGLSGLTHVDMMAGFAASKGVPLAGAAVIISHLLLVVAGLCFLTGYRPYTGVAALVIFFVPVTFMMHAFWHETSLAGRTAQMINFTKNFALLGSGLMFLAIPRPWPWSVESRRRSELPGGPRRTAPAGT
jgi:uncharacterized membrane protein YphA (DoxX/SURF4 family)